jgi:hypothetical protein
MAVTRWINDFESAGEEPLPPEQQELLRASLRRSQARRVLYVALSFLALFSCFGTMMYAASWSDAAPAWLAAILLPAMFLFPFMILKWRDEGRRIRNNRRDLETGFCERFELRDPLQLFRHEDEETSEDEEQLDDNEEDSEEAAPPAEKSPQLFLLKPSERLLLPDGRITELPFPVAEVAERRLAPVPEGFPRPLHANPAGTTFSDRRALSHEEVAELAQLATVPYRRYGCLFGMTIWLSAGLLVQLLNPSSQPPSPFAYVLGGLVLLGWLQFLRAALARRRLRQDLTGGYVVVVQPDPHPEVRLENLEWLPTSRAIWTVNGQPAPWRRSG